MASPPVPNLERLQAVWEPLGPEQIDALLRRWLARLPHPFTPQDREAGYRYDLSILQAEFSLTQILDRPLTGRIFFEEIIRENLDLGRPHKVQLVFERRVTKTTPARFRTRVLTQGVIPSLPVDYKSSRIISSSTLNRFPECPRSGLAPRPRLTTHVTFTSANGWVTCPLCGRSAFNPTDVFSKLNVSAMTVPWEKKTCTSGIVP